jgi:hypothetical protein
MTRNLGKQPQGVDHTTPAPRQRPAHLHRVFLGALLQVGVPCQGVSAMVLAMLIVEVQYAAVLQGKPLCRVCLDA